MKDEDAGHPESSIEPSSLPSLAKRGLELLTNLLKTPRPLHFEDQPPCGTIIFHPNGDITHTGEGVAIFHSSADRFAHASGHQGLRELYEFSTTCPPEDRDAYQKIIVAIETWAGVVNGKWTKEQDERFANQFEFFWATKMPTVHLEPSHGEPLDQELYEFLKRNWQTSIVLTS